MCIISGGVTVTSIKIKEGTQLDAFGRNQFHQNAWFRKPVNFGTQAIQHDRSACRQYIHIGKMAQRSGAQLSVTPGCYMKVQMEQTLKLFLGQPELVPFTTTIILETKVLTFEWLTLMPQCLFCHMWPCLTWPDVYIIRDCWGKGSLIWFTLWNNFSFSPNTLIISMNVSVLY